MRNTLRTGGHYETLVRTVLERDHLLYKEQENIGTKPGSGRHIIDFLAWHPERPDQFAIVSCKVQTVGGTAEEKIPYEVIKLLHAKDAHSTFVKIYLIMGGSGWSQGMRDFIRHDLQIYLPRAREVTIYTTDELLTHGITL